jgi:phosphoribosylanthranilate isomerase
MSAARDISFVIKICGITNEEDAQFAIEAGANALGFNFYAGSPRYVTPVRANQIVAALKKPFLRVGVFVNATEAHLATAVREVPLDVVQLHGENYPAQLSSSYRMWRSISADGADSEYRQVTNVSAEAYRAKAYRPEAYIFDAPTSKFGGSGKSFDWSLAATFAYRKIIAGGLDATNVADAIRTTKPWGVDACSRLESSPGKKDSGRVRDFIHAALTARTQEIAL